MKKWIYFATVLMLCVLVGCEGTQNTDSFGDGEKGNMEETESYVGQTKDNIMEEAEDIFSSEDAIKGRNDTLEWAENNSQTDENIREDTQTGKEDPEETQEEIQLEEKTKVQDQEQAKAQAEAEAQAQAEASEEAAQVTGTAVTEVNRMYVEDCGEDSGYWIITYSDGHVEYIDD